MDDETSGGRGETTRPPPRKWAPTETVRQWYDDGLTLHEIALANAEYWATRDSEGRIIRLGYMYGRPAVSKKLKKMKVPPRRGVHADLLIWRLAPEHKNSRWRFALRSESRRRQNKPLTAADQRHIDRLYDRLTGQRGEIDMVICYDRKRGFYFVDRNKADDDIVRKTNGDVKT